MASNSISYYHINSGKIYFPEDIPCLITTKNYYVKLANTKKELAQIQKLLHKTFSSDTHKIKEESRDEFAHHLIVYKKIDNKEKIIGTLRLINKDFLPKEQTFRSEDFFNIQNLLTSHKSSLELSRFCVAESYRDKGVLLLLWKSLLNIFYFLKFKLCSGLALFQDKI